MKKLLYLTTLYLLFSNTYLLAQCDPNQEYIALRTLYLSTDGDNWTNTINGVDIWPDAAFFDANPIMPVDTDFSTWFGIIGITGGGCIKDLHLFNNQLNGTLPDEIGLLNNLVTLTLNDNELTGSIPGSIGNLNNLTQLRLYNNSLDGCIPNQIGSLSSLVHLDLRNNSLACAIPTDIGNLTNLTFLRLDTNLLMGVIPNTIGNLGDLTTLYLRENSLTGNIPASIGNLTNLIDLYLHDNDLSGCYDSNLMSLCSQLSSYSNTSSIISDGNNFDASWEDFCSTQAGICSPCTADIITQDQEICDNFFQVVATPPEAGETGMWTGPTGTAFSDVNDPTTFITALSMGSNVITWTIFDSDGIACSSAQITLINSEVQTTPVIITANDTEVCDENGFQLEAEGSLLLGEIGSWTSDNPNVTFTNPNSSTTTVNDLGPGNNVIFWAITNGGCETNPASITVINNEVVTTAAIEPFSAQESCVTNGFDQLFANISAPNNQLIPGETGTWSTVPPNSGVTFSPNSESPTVNGLLSGENVLIWTISRGNCPTNSTSITITNNEPNNVNINIGDSNTSACTEDALNLVADPPNANQTGMWTGPAGAVFDPNSSSSTVSVTGTPPGTHNFHWTLTQGGCELSDFIQVEVGEPTFENYAVNNTTSVGGSDGSIDFCIEGGTPPFNIVWQPFENINILNQTSTLNCSELGYNLAGLNVGTYMVTITDANGCSNILGDAADEDTEVMYPDCSDFVIENITTVDIPCFGGTRGTVTIEVSGTTPPITYDLSDFAGTVTVIDETYTFFQSLDADNYYLTVTDATGCNVVDSFTITQPDSLYILPTVTAPTQPGMNDGVIVLCVEGGEIPFTLTSDSGVSIDVISGDCNGNYFIDSLSAGAYVFDLIDSAGCEVSETVVVPPSGACTIQIDSVIVDNHVSCFGGNDGQLIVYASQGVGIYQFSIDGGDNFTPASSPDILFVNVNAGEYNIIVMDDLGCTDTFTNNPINIIEPADFFITQINTTDVSAPGADDGQIDFCVNGGNAPYTATYTGINTGTSGTFSLISSGCAGNFITTNLSGDTYTIEIMDANSCTETFEVFIDDVDCTPFSVTNPSHVACNGDSTGTIEMTTSEGFAPYTFIIDNGTSTDSIFGVNDANYIFENLPAGDYNVTAIHSGDCVVQSTTFITEPPPLSATISTIDPTSMGSMDGEICITPEGGAMSYTVNADCGVTTQMAGNCGGTYHISGLDVGECTITVVDDNGCVYSTTTELLSSSSCDGFSIVNTIPTNVACHGDSTGAIEIITTGGTTPYNFIIDNGTATDTILGINEPNYMFNDLPVGSYTLTIIDSQNCSIQSTTFITEPSPLSVTISTIDPMTVGGTEGEICITPIGGAMSYTVSTGCGMPIQMAGNCGGTYHIPNLSAGECTITVVDDNGCIFSTTTELIDPSCAGFSLDNVSSTGVLCAGGSDGSITIEVSGGEPLYRYSINGGNPFIESANNEYTFENISAGSYDIVVNDSQGCDASSTPVIIEEPTTALTLDITVDENVNCNNGNDGQATAMPMDGAPPYTYEWSASADNQNTATATDLPAGTHSITVTDNDGCEISGTTNITQPPVLNISIAINDNVSCVGEMDGKASAVPSGGTPPYTYAWSASASNQIDSIANNLSTGVHTLTITDANGCIEITSTTLGEPTCGTPDYMEMIPCDDSISITVNDSIEVLICDNNIVCTPCTGEVDCTLTDLAIENIIISDVNSCANPDGEIIIDAMGSWSPFEYSIDGGNTFQTDSTFTELSPNIYNTVVRDNYGCEISGETVTLEAVNDIRIDFIGTINPSICLKSDGEIAILVGGGSEPFEYSKDGGLSFQSEYYIFTELTENTYEIVVRDNDSCEATATVTLTEEGQIPNVSVPAGITPNGDGYFDVLEISTLRDPEYESCFTTTNLIIFNRWGDPVYEMKNYGLGNDWTQDDWWDGTCNMNNCNGELLPKGTYYYTLYLNSGKPEKGSVFIL